ncbi:MAG: PD-(D/E)XK nuclease family transposase [Aureispira sp.]
MSEQKEKYINPLTDFGFKLQDRIFAKLFEAAEIAKFTPKEREAYEESLKYYRDIKNVVDTSREEGIKEVARKMKIKGMSNIEIQELTGLTIQEIENL